MLPLLLVALGALSTARLTRLATADYLTLPLRRRVLQAVQEGGRAEYLLSCAWCASIWIAAPVAIVVMVLAPQLRGDAAHNTAVYALLLLTFSQVAGLSASAEADA